MIDYGTCGCCGGPAFYYAEAVAGRVYLCAEHASWICDRVNENDRAKATKAFLDHANLTLSNTERDEIALRFAVAWSRYQPDCDDATWWGADGMVRNTHGGDDEPLAPLMLDCYEWADAFLAERERQRAGKEKA